ncbi:MAG: DUF4430 domain-containing protein [Candidatus Hodarchaeota archaeon]
MGVAIGGFVVLNYSLPMIMNQIYNTDPSNGGGGDTGGDDPVDDPWVPIVNITLSVDYNNGTVDFLSNLSLPENKTTVFDLIDANFEIDYDVYAMGYFITEINGMRGSGWTYYVDSVYASKASNFYTIVNNSIVEWVCV